MRAALYRVVGGLGPRVQAKAATSSVFVTFQDTSAAEPIDLCRDVETSLVAATCTYTFTSVGPHKITAFFSYKKGGLPAATTTVTHLVAGSDVTLVALPSPASAGDAITFTAVAGGGAARPTGIVSLFENGQNVGCVVSLAPSNAGRASCILTLPAGVHSLVARYVPDEISNSSYKASASEPFTLTVGSPLDQATASPTSPEDMLLSNDAPAPDEEAPLDASLGD
jgi:hypothetical protein